jgi:hypothetical protein
MWKVFTRPSCASDFFTPEFSQEILKFKNTEYEVHQSSQNDEGQPKSQI